MTDLEKRAHDLLVIIEQKASNMDEAIQAIVAALPELDRVVTAMRRLASIGIPIKPECVTRWADALAILSLNGTPGSVAERIDIAALEEQSEAWFAVCRALDKAAPGWCSCKTKASAIQLAESAIAALAQRPKAEPSGWLVMSNDGDLVRFWSRSKNVLDAFLVEQGLDPSAALAVYLDPPQPQPSVDLDRVEWAMAHEGVPEKVRQSVLALIDSQREGA